jgi:uroporphyrinogen III methyltransferase/synthase
VVTEHGMRDDLSSREHRPLSGKHVLLLRATGQAGELSSSIRALGGEPIELPAIEIAPPASFAPLDEALVRLGSYHWILFTSQNAAVAVFARLETAGRDTRAFGRARVCAIGGGTALALKERGIIADLVPEEAVAEGIVRAFAAEEIEGKRFFLPRAAEARERLPEALRLRGAQVDVVAAYRTLRAPKPSDPTLVSRLEKQGVDVLLFASGSQVEGFFGLFPDHAEAMLKGAVVCAIGPITAEALAERGARVDVVPQVHSTSALLDALVAHLQEKR